jgi:tyrosine-protein kinase Etk/Wzc
MQRAHEVSAEVIDLADVFRSIRNGWRTVAVCTVLGVAAAIAVLLFVPPSYSGKASIVLKTGNSGGPSSTLAAAIGALSDAGGGGLTGGALPGLKSSVETEVDILQSRVLSGQIVDSLMLQARVTKPFGTPATHVLSALDLPGAFKKRVYEFKSTGGAGAPRSYRFLADADSGVAIVGQATVLTIGTITLSPDAPATEFKVGFFDHEDATSRLVDNLKFDKPKGDVAHVDYHGDDSLSAAAVPNLLLSLYLARRKGQDRGVNQRSAEFLALKVDSVGRELAQAERSLRATRETTGVLDPTAVGKTEYENENRLRQQLTDITVQQKALEQLVTQVKNGTATPRQLAAYPQFLAGTINGIVSSIITVETQRLALLTTRTPEDAEVKSLSAQQDNLESQLMPLAQQTLSSLGSQKTSIQDRLAAIQTSLTGVPREVESYGRLERNILDLGRIYAGLQTQLVDARLAAITEGGDVRPLDRAVPPKKPVFPTKTATLAAGAGGGLFVGLILAVVIGIVGGRMHDAQDVERRTGLAAVRFEASAPLLVGGPASRTVLVAPIDSRAFAKPVAERLVETAMSRSLSATVLDLTTEGLRVAGGESGMVPAKLVTGNGRMGNGFDANAAIARLEETHDLVVVQLPALSSHAAAAVLSSTRPVLLVAPERRIERKSLQSAVDLLRRVGAPCAGVVLHGNDHRSLGA